VVNGIAVEPPEEDAPIRIEEAVRIAHDKDPFVDASQVRVGVRHRTVRLTGAVRSREARDAAEWQSGMCSASTMSSMNSKSCPDDSILACGRQRGWEMR
jgi:hypothetical protein